LILLFSFSTDYHMTNTMIFIRHQKPFLPTLNPSIQYNEQHELDCFIAVERKMKREKPVAEDNVYGP